MGPPKKRLFWSRARLTFRWFRIAGWLLILAAVCALLWLNRVGLPEVFKQRILAALRAHGLDIAFARLRLHWTHGVVAERVRWHKPSSPSSPQLSAEELIIRPDFAAWMRRDFRLRGFSIEGGTLTLPLAGTNTPSRALEITRLHSQVDFLTDDRWQLSAFTGESLGVTFHLSGTLTNAPALWARSPKPRSASLEQARFWDRLIACVEQVNFAPMARLKGSFSGDAGTPEASSLRAELSADSFRSPWGEGEQLDGLLTIAPQSNALALVTLDFRARHLTGPWGRAHSTRLIGTTEIPFLAPTLQGLRLSFLAESPQTSWGRAETLTITASSQRAAPPGWADDSHVTLKTLAPQTRWGDAASLDLQGTLRANPTNAARAEGFYRLRCESPRRGGFSVHAADLTAEAIQSSTNLWPDLIRLTLHLDQLAGQSTNRLGAFAGAREPKPSSDLTTVATQAKSAEVQATIVVPPFEQWASDSTNTSWAVCLKHVGLDAQANFQAVRAHNLDVDTLEVRGNWRSPLLSLDSIQAGLHGGHITTTARLDTVTGRAVGRADSKLDPRRLAPLLPTNAHGWLSSLKWEQAPEVATAFALIWPAWTNSVTDWARQVWPSLELAGRVEAGPSQFRSIPVLSTRGTFHLTNQHWRATHLELVRPEGALRLDFDFDPATERFQAGFQSDVRPNALRPIFSGEETHAALDYFLFTEPPMLKGSLAGRWGRWAETELRAEAALTNVTFRGQFMRSVVTDVTYTNKVLDFHHPRILREEGLTLADLVRVDFRNHTVNLTNAHGTVEVSALAQAIGPHIVKTLQPYQFAQPPTIHFQGTVGLHSRSGLDDARFGVSGGPFQWQGFNLDRAEASLHWFKDTLTITNFVGTLKGGDVRGDAWFDFQPRAGMDFTFRLEATNVSVKPLLDDLYPHVTNTLEGLVSGHLFITNASTASDRSWFGTGDTTLRDGLIWDTPVFRYLSPMLNTVVPGIANSRARKATATFIITNSIIATRDLEIHASAMRMQLEGTVDFDGRAQGKIEAELFRDTPAIGWMLSRVLLPITKIFVYKISGSLGNPKLEPLYIPKIFMAPFHPLRTLKELFSEEKPLEQPGSNNHAPKP